jgi:hypothetical protein
MAQAGARILRKAAKLTKSGKPLNVIGEDRFTISFDLYH